MPITIQINDHPAQAIQWLPKPTAQAYASHLRGRVDVRFQRHNEARINLLASSLNTPALPQIMPTKNGFVDACIMAYNHHHNLQIRPDDIWMAIITQFSFYVNGHADVLQDKFVPEKERKKISIEVQGDSWMSDSGWITKTFIKTMSRNLKEQDFHRWILPRFSTTTKADALCASIIMMGTLHSYFAYEEMALCGIPSVTLAGQQSDYRQIMKRLDRFAEFGEEMYVWGEMLRPIIRRFISAFDGQPDIDFWNSICHRTPEICGQDHYTGWITAFCPFDEKGQWQLYVPSVPAHIGHLYIDDIQYQALRADKVPWGFCQVDFDILNNDTCKEATFVAGLMGMRVTDTIVGSQSELGLDCSLPSSCISPHPAWFINEKEYPPPPPPPQEAAAGNLQDLHHFLRRLAYSHSPLSTGVPVLTLPPLGGPPPSTQGIDRLQKGDYYRFLGMQHNPPANPAMQLMTFSSPRPQKVDFASGSFQSSPTSPTESKDREGSRKLRKERRRPLALSTNIRG